MDWTLRQVLESLIENVDSIVLGQRKIVVEKIREATTIKVVDNKDH